MKRSIVMLFVVLCLVPAPDSELRAADQIVVTFYDVFPWACEWAAPFQMVEAYVAIWEPSQPVASVSFGLEIVTWVGYFCTPEVMDGWADVGTGKTYVLECTGPPAQDQMVLLLRLPVVITADTGPVEFQLLPPEGADHFEYLDDTGKPVLLTRRFGSYWSDAVLNPDGGGPDCLWDAVEAASWSEIKALYQ